MKQAGVLCVALSLAVGVSAQNDRADPALLVQQLNDRSENKRKNAREKLVALGARAVQPLTDALPSKADPAFARRILLVLGKLGPEGGKAVSVLIQRIESIDTANLVDLLQTIGDLAPYRAVEVDLRDLSTKLRRHLRRKPKRKNSLEVELASHRLRSRIEFPLQPSINVLLAALDAYRPYRVELAIEHLARRGGAATVPRLLRVLDRANPRIPRTKRTLLLREASAAAILKITQDGNAATRAKAVLAGAKPAAPPPVPGRAKARIASLISELGGKDEERVQLASENLRAYGRVAVPAIAAALPGFVATTSRSAALSVLRRLGKDAATASPALIEVLTEYPAEHTAEIFEALAEVAPWSRDVLIPASYIYVAGRLRLFGINIQGHASVDVINRIQPAYSRYFLASSIDAGCSLDELERLLEDPTARRREYALRLLRSRGTAAQRAVPALLVAMRASHPKSGHTRWQADGSVRIRLVSRDDELHRLAAEAVLANDPKNAKATSEARAVIDRLDGKSK